MSLYSSWIVNVLDMMIHAHIIDNIIVLSIY